MKKLLTIFVCLLLQKAQAQTANAGADKTIYLSQTNTVALDGSASSADSYRWTEVSTDYSSGGTITSPTSKTTTVSGLPQGVFYFQIAATTGSATKYDTVVVRVDYAEPPVNGTLLHYFNLSDAHALSVINNRADTTNFYPVSNGAYGQFDDTQSAPWRYYLFRDRSNGLEIDKQKGKLISTIQDGYISNDGYPRAEIGISGDFFRIDTNHIYTFEYKGYFPQNINYLTSWYEILTMFQIHSSAQVATVFGFNMDANGDVHGQDVYDNGSGDLITKKDVCFNLSDFYNSAHTIRFTIKEGKGYAGQDAFINIKIDGRTVYDRTSGQVGSTYYDDYIKFAGIYDWHSQMCSGDQLARGRKWSLVTEKFNVWQMSAASADLPTLSISDNQNISTNSTVVNSTHTFANGHSGSLQWSKVSGPGTTTFGSPNSDTTTISGLETGDYVVKCVATQDDGQSVIKYVSIHVELTSSTPQVPFIQFRITHTLKNQ